jgi:hypothetical protein
MLKRLLALARRLTCLRHDWRPSSSWPGVIVCRRCGHRKAGETPGRPGLD